MINLIGYLMVKRLRSKFRLSLKSFFYSLIITILTFYTGLSSISASDLSVNSSAKYFISANGDLTASIDCTFSSSNKEVLTFLTIGVPFLELKDVTLTHNNFHYETNEYKQKYQTNIVLDLDHTNLQPDTLKTFTLTFKIDNWLNTSTGHFSFPLLMTGTSHDKVILEIDKELGNFQLATEQNYLTQKLLSNKNIQYTVSDPSKISQLYFLIGDSFAYEFSIKQLFNNNGDVVQYYEIPLPHKSNELILIINKASNKNITYRKDQAGNLFAGITVNPLESVNLNINGEVIITKINLNNTLLTSFEIPNYLTTNTFWELSKENSNKFTTYLQANQNSTTNFTYDDLTWNNTSLIKYTNLTNKYIKNKLNITTSTNQLKEDVRIPADLALKQSLITAANYSDVAIAILRDANIPTRQVTGYVSNVTGEFSSGFMHTWTEYWTLDKGWITFDPAYEELSKLSGHAVTLSDHIPLIIRIEHPLKPNSGILTPESINFKYSTTFSSPINNINVNASNIERMIYDGTVVIPIEISNRGNQPIESTNLIINNEIVNLHDTTNLLMPGTTETFYYTYDIAKPDLSKDLIEQSFTLDYHNDLNINESIFSIEITAIQPWWWNYAFYSISALIIALLSFILFFLYNKLMTNR